MVWGAPPAATTDDAWLLDDAARAALRDALDRVDAAPISTIHGFCQRVLSDEAFAAGRAFEQQAVPDEAALRAAFLGALRERFAVEPEDKALLRDFLASGKSTDALFAWVLQLYRFDAPLAETSPAPHQALVARVLGEVVARADRSKRRGGQIDFHDMLRLTARALEADPALAARIATRLPWAMIDEFQDTGEKNFDIRLEVLMEPERSQPTTVCRSNFEYIYWSVNQQLAHHTVNGCNIQVGDMYASGTISGPSPGSYGSMLELTWNGQKPLSMPDGSERKFIVDGDTVIM